MIENYLKENINTSKINLIKSVYTKKTNTLAFWIVYPDKFNFTDEIQQNIQQNIKDYIAVTDINYEFHFKKTILDVTQLKEIVKNYFTKLYPSILTLTNFEDLSLIQSDSEYIVTFNIEKSVQSLVNLTEVNCELCKLFNKYFFANFSINITNNSNPDINLTKVLKENDNFASELALLRSTSAPQFEKYDIFQANAMIGEIVEKQAIRMDCLKNYSGELVIAGTTMNCQKITYTPKTVKEGEEPVEKIRLVFDLQDYWGEISCVYFPSQKTMALLENITDNMPLIVKGEKSDFNGRTNFKIRSIATLVMPEKPEEEEIIREPFDNYLVTKPFPYEVKNQLNLLTTIEERTLPNFVTNREYVVYDFETTGLSAETCQVIEIGAVKIQNGKITEVFSTLINCPEPLPEIIIKVTNITDEMLKDAPCTELAFADFYKFCQNATLVGYNNIDFDSKFLRKVAKRLKFKFNPEELDVFLMAKSKLRLRNYKLGTVVEALGIELNNAHRAYADATATAEAFLKLV